MRDVKDSGGQVSSPETRNGRTTRMRALAGAGLVGLLALLYLRVESQVATASTRLANLHQQRIQLEREEATLRNRLGAVSSPAYVGQQAEKLGLQPVAPSSVIVITLQPPRGGHS